MIQEDVQFYLMQLFIFLHLIYLLMVLVKKNQLRRRLSRLSIVQAILSVAVLTAGSVFLAEGKEAFLLFEISIGAVISFYHPVVALSFFMGLLLLRPWETLDSNQALIILPRTFAVICIFSALLYKIRSKNWRLFWNMEILLFVLFLLWIPLSALMSPMGQEGITFYKAAFIPNTVIFLLFLNVSEYREDLRAVWGGLIIAVAGIFAMAAAKTAWIAASPFTLRLQGTGLWENSNDLAALGVLVIIPCVVDLLKKRGSKSLQTLLVISAGWFLLCIWWTQSRAALIALGAAGMVYLLFCVKMKGKVIISLILACLLIAASFTIQRTQEDLEGSSASRLNYYVTGMYMLKSYPIFGVGIDGYPKHYEQFSQLFMEWGERTAHSSWLLVLTETGPIGFVFFMGLFILVFWRGWRIKKDMPEYLLALVSYGVAMSFLSHSYLILPYVLCALTISASVIHSRTESREEDDI